MKRPPDPHRDAALLQFLASVPWINQEEHPDQVRAWIKLAWHEAWEAAHQHTENERRTRR